jgi:hypothetical protein
MKKSTINLKQRPESYWIDDDLLKALLRNVKGTQRRKMITDYWKAGRLESLDDELLKDAIGEDARNALGRIHPAFMGGEYLPDYKSDEVEIARIELRSTTADVISIRARKEENGITYRVVDEYDTEFSFNPEHSRKPLSLGRLARLIDEMEGGFDGGPYIWALLGCNADCCGEIDRTFVRIRSDFYPELETWWDERLDQEIAERKKGENHEPNL